MAMIKNVAVIGAGRWGTAMALYFSNIGLNVTLCAHSAERAAAIRARGESSGLPGYPLPNTLSIASYPSITFETFDAAVISTPLLYLRKMLPNIGGLSESAVIVGINKGVEQETFMTPPQVVNEFFPHNPYAQLSGPCFPGGLLDAETKVAETLACRNRSCGLSLQKRLSSEKFRIYLSDDVDGVAYMGALKNIYALAAGFIEALRLNEETTAILITRALSEMKKFCRAMRISENTLYGLSGLGDLTLTCYSRSSSHNKTFGGLFAKNRSIEKTESLMNNSVAEGVFTTKAVYHLCVRLNIDMPIVKAVYASLYENRDIYVAFSELMNRPLKIED